MTREDRPGSGRLAPLRPEYRWSTPPAPGNAEPARPYPPKRSELIEPPASDYEVYDEADPAAWRRYDEDAYGPPGPERPRGRTTRTQGNYPRERYAVGDEAYDADAYGYADAPERVHQLPARSVGAVATPTTPPRTLPTTIEDTGRLPIQERQQLLMHTIQLYDDRWKLAGIRANQRKNWLQAYLTPRNKHLELKEAISRNQVLIITVDSRGNTEVKEPKKPRLLRRIWNWVFGS